jgi:hypothetical protein
MAAAKIRKKHELFFFADFSKYSVSAVHGKIIQVLCALVAAEHFRSIVFRLALCEPTKPR